MGVTVNAVAPGFMDTEMTYSMTDEQRAKIAGRAALKRLVDVEDVAASGGVPDVGRRQATSPARC